jgi:hypothetical protein
MPDSAVLAYVSAAGGLTEAARASFRATNYGRLMDPGEWFRRKGCRRGSCWPCQCLETCGVRGPQEVIPRAGQWSGQAVAALEDATRSSHRSHKTALAKVVGLAIEWSGQCKIIRPSEAWRRGHGFKLKTRTASTVRKGGPSALRRCFFHPRMQPFHDHLLFFHALAARPRATGSRTCMPRKCRPSKPHYPGNRRIAGGPKGIPSQQP